MLGVLISDITIHLSVFRLRQHDTEEWIMMVRSITTSIIHKRWCSSYDILDINRVILQGRTKQKLVWHFDLRNTTALTQSWIWMRYWSLFLPVILKQNGLTNHKNTRRRWTRMHTYSSLSIDRRRSEYNGRGTTQRYILLSELWMHRLVCRIKFNRFLPDYPCGEIELAESQYRMGNSLRALLLWCFDPTNFCHKWFIVFGRRKYHRHRGLLQRLLITWRNEPTLTTWGR